MMNITSFINDFAALTPSLFGRRVLRLALNYDENPDTPPPFTVLYQETPVDAPQTIETFTMQPVSTTRFQLEIPISETLLSNGGAMTWVLNDALGNLSGEWGGGANLTAGIVGGFQPQYREGAFTIKDFTVLTGIERLGSGLFVVHDIDFVNTQLLSMLQGATKMRRIASGTDPNFTLQFRARSNRNEEYTARRGTAFREYLRESARIIEFAVEEVRNRQKFDVENVRFSRVLR